MKTTFSAAAYALLHASITPAVAFVPHAQHDLSARNLAHKTKNNVTPLQVPSLGRSALLSPALLRGETNMGSHGSHLHARGETKLHVNKLDEPSTTSTAGDGASLLPSIFFLLSAGSLGKLAIDIYDSPLPMTIGIWSLFFTTIAVGWDNFVIGLGKPFFPDAETDQKQFDILKVLSYPRFTAHAVLVPFLYTTGAEIGKSIGVEWLQGDFIQTLLIVAAAVLGVISRVRFVQSPGIEIADTSDSPPEALENDLLWFTYKEPEFLYVVPSIILSLFNLAIGIAAFGGESRDAAIWMIISGVSVLYGNAKPSYVMRFTGNLAEVVMLWCIYAAASSVLL